MLVIGVKESAGLNAAMVLLNIGVILTVVGIGAAYIEPKNWRPFLHEDKGWRGVAEGAGRIFFAYIGFDSISTHAEEARRPQRDLAIGIMGALTICTVLYLAVAVVLTGMVPYRQIDFNAPLSAALQGRGLTFRRRPDHAGHSGGHDQLAVGRQLEPAAYSAGDGPRRALAQGIFAAIHPRFKTPWKSTILVGVVVAADGRPGSVGVPGRPGQHRHTVRVRGRLGRGLDPPVTDPDAPRPFRAPWVPFVSTMGILVNGG